MNYNQVIISILVMSLFLSLSSIQIQKAEDNFDLNNEVLDIGIGQPCSIQSGDVVSTGENKILITLFNIGDRPSSVDFECLIEKLNGFEWEEVDSGTNGPYDLDPDVWIESFFDVSIEPMGEYRATFSLISPVTHEPWTDDNPTNDVHQIVFSIRENAGKDIFVDDDANTGGDGSSTTPFMTITDALDQATPGDCIWIGHGNYKENLHIDTPRITIRPDTAKCDCDNPGLLRCVIDGDGTGNVITIAADWVTISGMTIQHCGGNEEDAAIDITSNNNIICWNTIQENEATGIYLHDSAQNNYIHHNIIRDNQGSGLFIWEASQNNRIYHNDFINNIWYNVKDKDGGNIWYNDGIFGGNYWDDYTGIDTNGDGIGESPYEIKGDIIQTGLDSYPWVIPHGWNNQPKTPIIEGISSGITGNNYNFNLTIGDEHFEPGSEPFEEHVYCWMDWGDGNKEYYGPIYLSNIADIQLSMDHQWEIDGSYTIQAKIIDSYEEESNWGTLPVSMPKNKLFFDIFLRFLENHPRFFPLLKLLIT